MLNATVAALQLMSALFLALGAVLCLLSGGKKPGSRARRGARGDGRPDR
jgi:hypothetical protein